MDVFVARQAIFDRSGELHGYELLFRSEAGQTAFDGTEAAKATTQVIANSLLTIGLENILCGKKAFVNFDRSLLIGGLHSILPPEILVVELLETVEPDPEVLEACKQLSEQGYTIALDDFSTLPRFEPLAEIAKLIKVDMRQTSRCDQERLLATYHPRGLQMLAEKVETVEEFEWAKQAGYDLFQGYFFARPAVVRGRQIPAAKILCLRLLAEMQQPELDFDRLAALIREDVSLSYKLLRYVNSSFFYRFTEIHSISHAVVVLGEDNLRHWIAIAVSPTLAKDKPGELVTLSLVRAFFCERIAESTHFGEHNLAFLMGLFSLLDALTDLTLEDALAQINVSPDIKAALTGTSREGNPLDAIYKLVCRYEASDWNQVIGLAAKLAMKPALSAELYAESTLWAHQALNSTARKTNTRRHVRHAISGPMRLLWEDSSGREIIVNARLVNVSVGGLQLQVPRQIPVSAQISCNDAKLGISGRGRVRYCNFVKGGYVIGVEFSGGTGWHPPLEEETEVRKGAHKRSSTW